MTQPRHIQHLADELLSEILSFLLEEPATRAPNGNAGRNGHNGHHAGEHNDHQSVYGEASELDRFRLVCKRFMRIGTPRKFARFNLRFSENGFRRLDDLLKMQLACYVKTVTYLVRPFYQGSGTQRFLHPTHRARTKKPTGKANTRDFSRLGTGTSHARHRRSYTRTTA